MENDGTYEYFAFVAVKESMSETEWHFFEWHPRQQDEADEEQEMATLKEFVLNKESDPWLWFLICESENSIKLHWLYWLQLWLCVPLRLLLNTTLVRECGGLLLL